MWTSISAAKRAASRARACKPSRTKASSPDAACRAAPSSARSSAILLPSRSRAVTLPAATSASEAWAGMCLAGAPSTASPTRA
eukprot:1003416-Pyramimonas_sp.AAC.1